MNAHISLPAVAGTALTMSSRDIADLTEKRHNNVLRDIKVMLVGLYGQPGDRFEDLLTDSSDLRDQDISITCEKDARGYVSTIHLDKEHTITLVAGYDVRLRKRIVNRWLELERPVPAPAALSPEVLEEIRRTDGIARMLSHKVTTIEKAIAHLPALANAVTALTARVQPAAPGTVIRHGKTAGTILKAAGYTDCPQAFAAWFGNRLEAAGCRVEGRIDTGTSRARMFDPDKAEAWLANGGRVSVEMKLTEKRGQGALALAGGNVVSFAAHAIKDGLSLSAIFADACCIVNDMVKRGDVTEPGTPQHEFYMRLAFVSAVAASGIKFPRVTKDMMQNVVRLPAVN